MKKNLCWGWVLAGLILTGCSNDDAERKEPENPENCIPIAIITRTEQGGESSELQAGLYMVNYADGQQTSLQAKDNYVNNQLMNYSDGSWIPTTPIYWQDTNVNADFYAYAPYTGQIDDARGMKFHVATDQTSEEAFQKSDLLWGTAQGRSPMNGKFNLMLTHQLSKLTVVVTTGAGFKDGELTAENVAVTIGGSKTLGTVDLQNGSVTATGEVADVKCYNNGDLSYTAILLPQVIGFANFLKIDWNGYNYTLQRSSKLEAKTQYQLTVRLNKTQGGLDINIGGWDIVDEDFGGTVRL